MGRGSSLLYGCGAWMDPRRGGTNISLDSQDVDLAAASCESCTGECCDENGESETHTEDSCSGNSEDLQMSSTTVIENTTASEEAALMAEDNQTWC